jgi:hypothetical protein
MRAPCVKFAAEPRAPKTDRPAPLRTLQSLPSLAASETFLPAPATNALDDEVNQLRALNCWWRAMAEDKPWNYTRYFDAAALCLFLADTFIRDVANSPMGDEYLSMWPYASPDLQDAWYNCRIMIGFTTWPSGAADHTRRLLQCIAAPDRQQPRCPSSRHWR